MIALLACMFFFLFAGFLLTLLQVHFAIAVVCGNERERGSSVRGSIVNGFYKKPKQLIDAVSLAKLLFFTAFLATSFYLIFYKFRLGDFLFEWFVFALFFLVVSFLYLLACEVLPRLVYGYRNKHLSIRHLVTQMTILYALFYPLVSLFSRFANLFSTRRSVKEETTPVFPDGDSFFDTLIYKQFTDEKNTPEVESELKIIRNVIDFSSVRVKDCMIPRTEVVSINQDVCTYGELKDKFSESGHSRIIVYKEDIDHIVGYIHSLEMFGDSSNWKEHIKDVPFVPETMAAHDLMRDLMQKQKNLAVVVDEFGGTAGIITLEDLVEEIFGEIEDEHDKKLLIERKINDSEYVFAGRMELDYINEKYKLNLPTSEDYLTLAGYLIYVNERFPKLNQVITVGTISFTILKMSPTKVDLVKVVIN